MRTSGLIVVAMLSAFVLTGCSEIDIPKADSLIQNPLGEGSLKLGMSKVAVIKSYGDPAVKRTVTSPTWNNTREEWMYKAMYSGLPVNAGHLSEDLYLYFDGDNLTNISRKPIGNSVEPAADVKK